MYKDTKNPSGMFRVSTNVINSIAETAASEIEGVAVMAPGKLAVPVNSPIAMKLWQPVKVKLGSDSAIISVTLITEAGYKAYEVAKSVQESVKSSVQSMTGITVSKVDVKVAAIKG